jgi:hypothetical protein
MRSQGIWEAEEIVKSGVSAREGRYQDCIAKRGARRETAPTTICGPQRDSRGFQRDSRRRRLAENAIRKVR